jgi:hypothetical protein
MRKRYVSAVLSLMFLTATIAYAQGTASSPANQPHGAATPSVGTPQPLAPPGSGSTGPVTDSGTKAADKQPDIKITELTLPPNPTPADQLTPEEKKAEAEKQAPVKSARLDDSIILHAAKGELKPYVQWATSRAKDITLYVNGSDTNIRPEATDLEGDTLQFHLERTEENKKLWSALLRQPFRYETRYGVKASISVDHREAVPSDATFNLLVVVWTKWSKAWLFLLFVFVILLIWLAWKHELLRDGPSIAKVKQPYSLGRCQMAWWFFLIIASYVFIWLICGDQGTITTSLLGLMGISAGTALGAALIESSSAGSASLSQAASDRIAYQSALAKAQQDLLTAQNALAGAPAATPALQQAVTDAQAAVDIAQSKLNDANVRLGEATKPPVTNFWLLEILSDSNGQIALHRFQIVVWTFVLGIMFLFSVVTELTMPEFSSTLLATMGISSGTYLGFKFPEK